MASCCLYKTDLSSGQAKKRRKKLHGSSCNNSLVILEKEIEKKFEVALDEVVEIDRDSFLCRFCDMNLLKMSELRQKLIELDSDLQKSIGNFHFQNAGQKRMAPISSAACSKRSC